MTHEILPTLGNEQRNRFALFADMLLEENRSVNLTAITEGESVRLRHFEDSLAALPLLRSIESNKRRHAGHPELSLIDVGSGAGLPALALAIALPEWHVVSLESTGKKARFQEKVVRALSLENVSVIRERAETLGHDPTHRERYDVATARALASLSVLAELTLPFVRPGGMALAWKGPLADTEIVEARGACTALGGEIGGEHSYCLVSSSGEIYNLRLIRIDKTSPTPASFPRKPGIIKKRPLTGRRVRRKEREDYENK